MTPQNFFQTLRDFDLEQLADTDTIGTWPLPIKTLLWSLAFLVAFTTGYLVHITDLQGELRQAQAMEPRLKDDYRQKYLVAAPLAAQRAQQEALEESFAAVLRQFPSESEVPGLIEDITQLGLTHGLTFTRIELQPEVVHDFYVAQPIALTLIGNYHGLGAFLGDVSGLSRILTLHSFVLQPVSASGTAGNQLRMQILARTYRYQQQASG